jgi:glycosyltransferase involved in cell wall biosynthesis
MSREEKQVDVVIPVYNGARFLEETVRSAVGQTLAPARVIISDDGSTDDTADVARRLASEFPCVDLLRLPRSGVSAARNAGITASTAPFVAFLDADDLWLPEKLAKQIEVFAYADPSVGFVHTSYLQINEDGSERVDDKLFPPSRRGDIFFPLLLEDYALSGSASGVLVKRSVLDQTGLFDTNLYHGEDWDLWLRLATVSGVDYCTESLVKIRVHPNSAQRRRVPHRDLKFLQQRLMVYDKWSRELEGVRGLREGLRRQVVRLLLPVAKEPWAVEKFYANLARNGSSFSATLFSGRLDLWSSLMRTYMRS